MTIVKKIELVQGHEFTKLDARLVEALDPASGRKGQSTRAHWIAFEAFLQLAGRPTVAMDDLSSPQFRRSVELYIGALTSDRFIGGPRDSRFQHAYRLIKALRNLDPYGHWGKIDLAYRGAAAQHELWRAEFEAIELDPDMVWLWGGWGGQTKRGVAVTFPLYPVYKRMGRDFTEQLHGILQASVARQASPTFKVLRQLCEYIGTAEVDVSPELFQDKYWCGKFFNAFGRAYFKEMGKRGNVIRHAANGWKHSLIPLVSAMARDGLIASPEPPVAAPRAGVVVKGRETRIHTTQSGITVKRTCLTEIPLEVSDTAAKQLLFREIVDDFAAVVTWAEKEADDLWRRHTAASEAAKLGEVRARGKQWVSTGALWHGNPENPDALANSAATYRTLGLFRGPFAYLAYGQFGMTDVAYALGIPTPASLLPHAALLVANHAELTSEFLSSLDLFDAENRRAGLQVLDGGTYLVGYKRRRGGKLAEQKIRLNERTTQLVEQVIEMTEPLRGHLRSTNGRNWRRLFLTLQSMNSAPDAQHFANQCTKPHRFGRNGMAASFVERTGVTPDAADALVRGFSLRSLRASTGLIVYLKTKSTKAMSEALAGC